jgi:alkanesulfonate monooxygenase SsuD/methylene tetrahydromethanopterin reductase-like flavin-dependent oxidoreductase (luciferase family)
MTDSNQAARPTVDIEFGLDSFVPISVDESGQELSCDVVIRNTVEEAVLADAVGIDSFNIAEHYRSDMMDSAGHVILAAIAGRTERIRLGTAVTVLSTQDPVRVFTEFSTLDAVSNGRAQLIVGRGSLTESFPLFGYDLADYEDIFEEKLELLTRLLRDQPVTWLGKFRAPLTNQSLSPPLREGHLPTWVGVGGSPQSVIRAARYRLPLMLAVIAARQSDSRRWSTSTNERSHSHGYVAKTDEEAAEIQWSH